MTDKVLHKGFFKTVVASNRVRMAANRGHIEITDATVYFLLITNRIQQIILNASIILCIFFVSKLLLDIAECYGALVGTFVYSSREVPRSNLG
jgi:hypothetical protein